MGQIATAPHECEGHLVWVEHGLGPYWAVGQLLIQGYDEHGSIETEINGETWQVELAYQKSGFAPRARDPINSERLYEYNIITRGDGQRKASYNISPRFPNIRHWEKGHQITMPFDHIEADEGIDVEFRGSNVEPDLYKELLPRFVQALAAETHVNISSKYFRGPVHSMSNIYTYERYVRLTRNMNKKLIGNAGAMQKIQLLLASERDTYAEITIDNEDVVGKRHQCRLSPSAARLLTPKSRHGKQLKSYLKKNPNSGRDGDATKQPKFGVLLKKGINNGNAFAWSERDELRQEIDEVLLNVLAWSDIPTSAGGTTYVPDLHFEARAAEEPVAIVDDPTPKLEASQESLLVTTLRDMTDADIEVVESLLTDGSGQHPRELAENTGRGISTIYRALQRMEAVVKNENACVSFASRKFADEVQAIVESTEHQVENAADRAAKILNMDAKQAASSAFQMWLNEYGAEVLETVETGRMKIRIDTILSQLKSSKLPRLSDALHEGRLAWIKSGYDIQEFNEARIEWKSGPGDYENLLRAKTVR